VSAGLGFLVHSLRLTILVGLSFLGLSQVTRATLMTARVASNGDAFIISCDAGPFPADYKAETASSVPLTDRYAIERRAGKGLVRLMAEGGPRVRQYKVPHNLIQAIVSVSATPTY
jgi:hypothetical protein